MKKKLQVFISSTYSDLLEERQSSVEAVLRSGNIPAGMELFSAGNKSQIEVIKRWIDESDIYMLILGGRYGSIEPESNLSYTELEYQYAISINKPLFAIVLHEDFIEEKIKKSGSSIIEMKYQDKFKEFKCLVLSKICRICKDSNEIKLSIMESIMDIQKQNELSGWIKGSELPDYSLLLIEINKLKEERDELARKINKTSKYNEEAKRSSYIGDHEFLDIYTILESKKITIPEKFTQNKKELEISLLRLFILEQSNLTIGVSSSTLSSEWSRYLTKHLVPILLNFSLIQREKTKIKPGVEYIKFIISDLGNKFLSLYHIHNLS